MSFYTQPTDWYCGPFALKHALIMLGQRVSELDIQKYAKAHWWSGTDEIRLAAAAQAFGCELKLVRTRDAKRARSELRRCLRAGHPAVLCVDEWEHWVCLVGGGNDAFVILDSNNESVVDVMTWTQLRKRWQYRDVDYDEDDPPVLYDLFEVVPHFRVKVKADFSVARARFLLRKSSRPLALHWNEYLEDLLAICRPFDVRMTDAMSMAELLRRNRDRIVTRITYWHGEVGEQEIGHLLDNFRFVAETYGLVIPAKQSRGAVLDIAILATMLATTLNPLDAFYDIESTSRR